MNKKSQIFNVSLVLITIVVLVNALFVLTEKKGKFEGLFVGSKQFDIIEKYSEGENVLTYIEQSSKYAAQQSVYDLGKQSGFHAESGCGNYSGLKLWNNLTDYCFPEAKEEFKGFLNNNLNEQLAKYPSSELPLNNYDFLIDDKIIGIAAENVVFTDYELKQFLKENLHVSLDSARNAYDANPDIVELTKDNSEGINHLLLMGIIMAESRWNEDTFRCEEIYETGKRGPAEKLIEDLGCTEYGCDKEIDYNGKIFHKVSCSYGLAQLMYPTAWELGHRGTPEDLKKAENSIRYAVANLKKISEQLDSSDRRDWLAAYNAGVGNVKKAKERCGDKFENYFACLPIPEITGVYVPKVLVYTHFYSDIFYNQTSRSVDQHLENIINFKESKPDTLQYSIKPSFTTSFDYNFEVYDALKEQILLLVESCSGAEDVIKCVNSQIELYNKNELNWKIGSCGHPVEQVYYNLYENFYDCLNTKENNCYCEFSPLERIERIEGISSIKIHFKPREDKKINITLIQGQQQPTYKVKLSNAVELEEPSFIKEFDENNNPVITRTPFIYDIEYRGGRFVRRLFKIEVSFPPIKIYEDNVILYKKGNDLSFVSTDVFNEHKDFFGEKCSLDRTIRFCVTGKETMPVYDIMYDNNKLRNIPIQFAITFSDSIAPPMVENVEVVDTPKAENSATISWKENEAEDVKSYKIYYSTSEFEEIDDSVKLIKIVDNDVLETVVEGMELYDDGKEINEYYFAVTAIDFSGNEDSTVNSVMGQAIDDLRPNKVSEVRIGVDGSSIEWDAVTNEDNSEAVDVEYQIYHSIDGAESMLTTLDKDATLFEFPFMDVGTHRFGVKAVDETLEGTIIWSSGILI